jgi:hypothetical protein
MGNADVDDAEKLDLGLCRSSTGQGRQQASATPRTGVWMDFMVCLLWGGGVSQI